MVSTWEQLYVELREALRKIPGLRNYDRGQYSPDRIQEASRLAGRFRELAPQFRHFEHPEDKLSTIRDYVQFELPWKAGSHLCDLYDARLFKTQGSASTFNKSDFRTMSGTWCKEQLEALDMAPEPVSAELRNLLERRSAIEAGETDHQRFAIGCYAVRFCWWSFICELAEREAHRSRMKSDVDEYWRFVEEWRDILNGSAEELPSHRKQVRGETEDDRSLLKLRHEAGIQATACEIVAELLEQVIEVEEQQLSRQDIPTKSSEDDSGIAEPSDPSKMPNEFGYVAVPPDWSAYMPQSEVIAAETPSDLGITEKKMKVIPEHYDQNQVRWTRPLNKEGKPIANRCSVHLVDWKEYLRKVEGKNTDEWSTVTPDEAKAREQATRKAKLMNGKRK